ncbi:ABC-2 family transporter protein [Deinococcus sp. QL22]|uniref:ABC transporter permease n=1 Tax=Deinococcus sp. QL22 TaxID=2939437 RepID=UPI0020176F83|nr:ABC-2 family transporter protein [Deinococcus sp. QL22]UQN07957.1 ABC-2 family transporter protein [Deinococcus sp. QL22]
MTAHPLIAPGRAWISAFVYLVRIAWRMRLAYRGKVLLEMIQPILTLYAFVYVWRAVKAAGAAPDVNLESLVTYSLVTAVLGLCISSDVISRLIERDIASGDIGQRLIRPLSFAASSVATSLGTSLASFVLRAVPLLAVTPVFIDRVALPRDPKVWGMFALLLVVAIIVALLLDLIVGYLCFWVFQGRHVRYFFEAIFTVFSGQFVPLVLLPDWMRTVSLFTPTRLVFNDPVAVLTGLISPQDYLGLLVRAGVWLVSLVMLTMTLHRAAVRRVFMQGG